MSACAVAPACVELVRLTNRDTGLTGLWVGTGGFLGLSLASTEVGERARGVGLRGSCGTTGREEEGELEEERE